MGAGFALLLLLCSPRVRSFTRLSQPVVGVLGAVAAVGVSAVTLGGAISPLGALVVAIMGAANATASLYVARRAPHQSLDAQTDLFHLPTV